MTSYPNAAPMALRTPIHYSSSEPYVCSAERSQAPAVIKGRVQPMSPYTICLRHFFVVMALALQKSQSMSLCGNINEEILLVIAFNPSVRCFDGLVPGATFPLLLCQG